MTTTATTTHSKTRQGEKKSGFFFSRETRTKKKQRRTAWLHLTFSVFSSMLRKVLKGEMADELYEQTERKKAEGSQLCRVND